MPEYGERRILKTFIDQSMRVDAQKVVIFEKNVNFHFFKYLLKHCQLYMQNMYINVIKKQNYGLKAL